MAPKKKPEEQEPGAPGWMTTFADLMSLLLTFFVLLLSFSTMEEKKVKGSSQFLAWCFGRTAKKYRGTETGCTSSPNQKTPSDAAN